MFDLAEMAEGAANLLPIFQPVRARSSLGYLQMPDELVEIVVVAHPSTG